MNLFKISYSFLCAARTIGTIEGCWRQQSSRVSISENSIPMPISLRVYSERKFVLIVAETRFFSPREISIKSLPTWTWVNSKISMHFNRHVSCGVAASFKVESKKISVCSRVTSCAIPIAKYVNAIKSLKKNSLGVSSAVMTRTELSRWDLVRLAERLPTHSGRRKQAGDKRKRIFVVFPLPAAKWIKKQNYSFSSTLKREKCKFPMRYRFPLWKGTFPPQAIFLRREIFCAFDQNLWRNVIKTFLLITVFISIPILSPQQKTFPASFATNFATETFEIEKALALFLLPGISEFVGLCN